MSDTPRRPRVFRIEEGPKSPPAAPLSSADDELFAAEPSLTTSPKNVKASDQHPADETARPRVLPDTTFREEDLNTESQDEADLDADLVSLSAKRRFPWGRIAAAGLVGLVSLMMGLAIDDLMRTLFARAPWLGWLGFGLMVVLCVALIGFIAREMLSVLRLARIERLRVSAQTILKTQSRPKAEAFVSELAAFYQGKAETAEGRRQLLDHKDDVMEASDRLELAERLLLNPLDQRATDLIAATAKRVSLVTAISPRAFVDLVFVLFASVKLISALAQLYGTRPGTFGFLRLLRQILAHLLMTGGLAASDALVDQVVGQGLAAKLSARLGEGLVNGILTARLGIAAAHILRPMPYVCAHPPRVKDILRNFRLSA